MGRGRGVSCDVARLMAAIVAASVVLDGSMAAAAAMSHVVGGSTGWTIPPNTTFYSEWSSSQTFAASDTLVFNFPSGIHNVIEVPKSSYDACTSQKKVGSILTSPPAAVTLTSGDHYYICGVNGHCSAGQKLFITVVSSTPSASTPAPSPTVGSPAPSLPSDLPNAPGGAPSSTTVIPPTAFGPSSSASANGSSSAPLLIRTKQPVVAFLLFVTAAFLF